ncbi:alpha-mannosidase [Agreia pratensis]|uniref:Alpha-mannosidase n=1 Tax=Agreia pratensis TaxID=150121 RepID=A0A1X7L3Z1_9MICO|nr:glycoside hydrolase family 38 C-terminal domain-containing protein [Agreia pratensis]SMG47942.1 alpha-mannosidase [Agreia pratensis]
MHLDQDKSAARVDRFLGEYLPTAIVHESVPVAAGAWTVAGEPVPFSAARDADFTPMASGTRWGEPWGTTWLHITGTVPERWQTQGGRYRIELSLDLGFSQSKPGFQCEGLVRTPAGRAVKGLEPRNHHVPLDALPGETFEFYVEAASNPDLSGGDDFKSQRAFAPTPFGDRSTAPAGELYTLGRLELRLIDVELESFELELRVLRGLMAELADSDPRRLRILLALGAALDALDPDDLGGSVSAGRAVLEPVLAAPAAHSAHRIVATGHAHIDSAWLWPTRETVRKCIRTFSNVLDLMDRDPELNFTCSSAQQYAWVKAADPELFSRLAARVSEGRFVPVGNMWVESDVTMPSGESLARQLLEGGRFFIEEFGQAADVGWLPDSFGYSGALPQLLRQAGLRWFFTQKMSWNETNAMPHHSFVWEGIDGSRIFTHFPPVNTYSGDMRPTELARDNRNFSDHGMASTSLMPFGYGDGGGGPTRDMMAAGRLQGDLEGSPKLRFATAREFFTEAEAEYVDPPVWSGEMYLEFHRGIFTSQARTKRGNRRNERLLAEAETWASAATVLTGAPYPGAELDELWRAVLLLQFHDILPGTAIAWVHREAEASHAETTERLEKIIATALRHLTGEGEVAIALNASPVTVRGIRARAARVVEEDAAQVSAMTGSASAPAHSGAGSFVLENDVVVVVVEADGTISRMSDKVTGRDLIADGRRANLLQLHRDEPNQWDAWDLDASYRASSHDLIEGTAVRDGDAVIVRRQFGSSSVVQRIELDGDAPTVRIRSEIDWHERRKLLKLAFPLDLHAPAAAYETQFGHVSRPVHTNTSWDAARYEVCAHRWVHVGEPGFGAAIANDGLYGHDVTRQVDDGRVVTVVRQSLLRAPTFPDPEADQGDHIITSTLTVAPDIADAIRAGRAADAPTRVVRGARVPSRLIAAVAPAGSTVTSVIAETVKLAADASGDVIVRLYESEGRRSSVRIEAGFATESCAIVDLLERPRADGAAVPAQPDGGFLLELRPFEVVTLRIRKAQNA